jgi:hypothetical protein
MKKCKASSGQNGQLVHWWLLVHSGPEYVIADSKIYCEKVKMCQFSSGNCFFCTNSCSLPWCATQLYTSKKECNKLDLTAAQYF